jgi:hypothetical protein
MRRGFFCGVSEVIMSCSYAVLGVPLAISLAASLLVRVVTLWFELVLSYFAFQRIGSRLLLGQSKDSRRMVSRIFRRMMDCTWALLRFEFRILAFSYLRVNGCWVFLKH